MTECINAILEYSSIKEICEVVVYNVNIFEINYTVQFLFFAKELLYVSYEL